MLKIFWVTPKKITGKSRQQKWKKLCIKKKENEGEKIKLVSSQTKKRPIKRLEGGRKMKKNKRENREWKGKKITNHFLSRAHRLSNSKHPLLRRRKKSGPSNRDYNLSQVQSNAGNWGETSGSHGKNGVLSRGQNGVLYRNQSSRALDIDWCCYVLKDRKEKKEEGTDDVVWFIGGKKKKSPQTNTRGRTTKCHITSSQSPVATWVDDHPRWQGASLLYLYV